MFEGTKIEVKEAQAEGFGCNVQRNPPEKATVTGK